MKIVFFLLILPLILVAAEPAILPHEEHQLQFGNNSFEEKTLPRQRIYRSSELSHEVYGFLPYWEYGGYWPPRYDLISRIAYFNIVLNSSGNVSSTRDWPTYDLISSAHAYGCKVDLCVAVFDDSDITSIISSSVNRSNACHNICEQMVLGADGINIDFEMPASGTDSDFYTFIEELADSIHSRDSEKWLSVCLPSVDWRGTFDLDYLLPHCDAVFLMGYGYYWGGSSYTGPVAPVDDPGCYYDYAYSIDHYCGSDAFKRSRFILGVPLYGYDWPCNGTSRGAATSGTGSASFYTSCIADTISYGCNWDSNAPCPWYVYGSYRQCWFDDAASLRYKYLWAIAEGLMGVGYWALGYDGGNDEIWNDVQDIFGGDTPADTIIDDYSYGFTKMGDISFWHEADTGYFHHMWWTHSTNATVPEDDTCFCTWKPNLPDRRYYEVFTYIPAINSVANARYVVNHDFGSDTVVIRQSDYFDEWVSLGTYSCEKGEGGYVYLGDGTGTSSERIGFDAIWWSRRSNLPGADTLVSIASNGFRWGGPLEYRRIVTGGMDGVYYWTNSITHGPDVNSARWNPVLPTDSEYDVFVYIPAEHSIANCVYKIKHAVGLAEVTLDQNLYSNEWVFLGTWRFTVSDSPGVYIGDSTGVTGENIAVDAVVWRSHEINVLESKLPNEISIEAYPNPFNSICAIKAPDNIDIYNLKGEKVFSSEKSELIWTGKDSNGNELASGLYLIKSGNMSKNISLIK